jgi:two-component system, OmpR family, alkaline phosphatase synthesis response regulator PhoP
MKDKILVVDDEKDILELIEYNLTRNGFNVTTVTTGEDALKSIKEQIYSLIVLDLMLPGIDGLEICKILKADKEKSHIPIIMLTAKGEEADIVAGLELGADDYITKPFSPRILISRIKTILRRKSTSKDEDQTIISHGDLKINSGKYEITYKGKFINLTHLEFRILVALAKRPGWVMTRYQIVDTARGDGITVTDRSVDVHIVSLRKKLGEGSSYIETVRGVGYKFKEI